MDEGRLASMKLLCFAHRGEAQAFLEHFNYLPTEHPAVYQDEQSYLVITGEGPIEALSFVSFVLGRYPSIVEVFNFGVAGSLGLAKLHEIYELRHGYLWNERRVEFKSFTLGLGNKDIVTTTERIFGNEKGQVLKPIADLVDREAWGIGMSCKNFNKPLRCFKYISDIVSESSVCELVKEKAHEASMALLERYLEVTKETQEKEEQTKINLSGFYFTKAMEIELINLLERLSIKYDRPKDFFLQELTIDKIREEIPHQKIRGKFLLQELKHKCDPEFYEVHKKISKLFSILKETGINITFDQNLESSELGIQFRADKESIMAKIQQLEKIPWQKFQETLEGKF